MTAGLRKLVVRAGTPVRKLAWEVERLRWRLFHPLTLGARVILLRGNEVLLIRHTYRPGWYFPGGGVEKGETLDAAARREAQEEAQALVADLELLGMYANFSQGKFDHVAVFVSREFEVGEFKPNNEIAERAWFSLDALPQNLSGSTRRRLEELRSGAQTRGGNW